MTRILVIDDEPAIRDLLELILTREGYQVAVAIDGNSGIAVVDSFRPDLVILDLMLPDQSGHEICKTIASRSKIPIIMLTAKNDMVDKILGLEFGADDYITKPFDTRELLLRIKALLRRVNNNDEKGSLIIYGKLQINLNTKTVLIENKQVSLTPREYQLLEVMAKSPKRVFSRDELVTKAWGYDYEGDSRAIDIQITRLRKKIERCSNQPEYIKTVYGFGYCFGGD